MSWAWARPPALMPVVTTTVYQVPSWGPCAQGSATQTGALSTHRIPWGGVYPWGVNR